MLRFSQKIGKRPIKTVLQIDSIDEPLKNRLWNTILDGFFEKISTDSLSRSVESPRGNICRIIWKDFFVNRIDEIPMYFDTVNLSQFITFIKEWYNNADWYDIYDFIQFLAFLDSNMVQVDFNKECNLVLEIEMAGYRIINDQLVQITSESEIQEIMEAIDGTDQWKSVNTHLRTALKMLSDRKNPNYRNSIKESISAIESLCIIITGDSKTTLSKALAIIEKSYSLHSALKEGFSKIYGYTSDSGGIRHSLLEEDIEVKFEDAKLIMVLCSAFINYLKSKMYI